MSMFPRPTSVWQHTNGNRYTVLCIANEFSERPEQYPPTVVYQGENGRTWSRAASDWSRSMTLVEEAVEPAASGADDAFLRAVMEAAAWRNAMTGLCTIWPKSPDEAADHLRKRLHRSAEAKIALGRLLWNAAKAIQWHLEPNSPDEHETLMGQLYQVATDMGAPAAQAAEPLEPARARGRKNIAAQWSNPENLTLAAVAAHTGIEELDIDAARERGTCYALTNLERRYPQWQFGADPDRLGAVLKPFLEAQASCWVIHNFMTRPHIDLGDVPPKEWILDSSKPVEPVVRLAQSRYQPSGAAGADGENFLSKWRQVIHQATATDQAMPRSGGANE